MKFTKIIGLVSGLILAATTSQAQQQPINIFDQSNMKQIFTKPNFHPSFNIQAGKKNKQVAKPTADTVLRPIAFADVVHNGIEMQKYDSMSFAWLGNNGINTNILTVAPFYTLQYNPYNLVNYYDNPLITFEYGYDFYDYPKFTSMDNYLFDDDTFYLFNNNFYYDSTETLVKTINTYADTTLYDYDTNGRLIKKTIQYSNETRIDSAIYNANGNLTNYFHYTNTGGYSHQYYYEYDTANKLIRKGYSQYYDTTLISASIDSFFALSNVADSVVYYTFTNGSMNKSEIIIVNKNANNEIIETKYYDPITLNYNYSLNINRNANGDPKEIYNHDGTDTSILYEIKYNNNGDIYEVITKQNMNGILTNRIKQTITYNAENLPVLLNYQKNYNDSTNTWELGENDIFTSIYYEKIGIEDTSTSVGKIARTQVSLYPNPAQDQLNISVGNETIKGIAFYDAMGRVIRTHQIANKANLDLNISTLPTGNYTIQVLTDKGTSTAKFVKK